LQLSLRFRRSLSLLVNSLALDLATLLSVSRRVLITVGPHSF
jgi:hypothetical protein